MVDRETANLVHTYCVFRGLKMQDMVHGTLREKLKPFEETLNEIKRIKA